MKDEIKDLLQYLKNVYESEETSTWLNKLQIKDLLDYITNLQNENMKYDQCLTELTDNYKDLQKELTNLQEENKRLKDIRNQAIDYNKVLCKIYDCGIELSNAETNLCILKDEETINLLQGKSDE